MEKGGYLRGKRYDCSKHPGDETGPHCALGAIDATHYTTGKYNRQTITAAQGALTEMAKEFIPTEGFVDPYNYAHVTRVSHTSNIIAGWSNMLALSANKVACVMRAAAQWIEEDKDANKVEGHKEEAQS